jgi:hypothetical protein
MSGMNSGLNLSSPVVLAAHNDVAFVIGRDGRVSQELHTGPGSQSTKASFAVLPADAAQQALGPS